MLEFMKKQRYWLAMLGIALAAVLIFLFFGMPKNGGVGFPLDDAWIHQTYAKNLVATGSWSYRDAKLSGGSTSPLWTLLISFGDLISIPFGLKWTFLLTIVSFLFLVISSWLCLQSLVSLQNRWFYLIPGAVIATEWHLLWAAGSGMETILCSLIIVLIFLLLLKERPTWVVIGPLCGLAVWIRPDGLTLLGPILFILIVELIFKKAHLKEIASVFVPLLFILAVYFCFNYVTTRSIFPNTFYAKQVEYQLLWATPLQTRFLAEFAPILTGAGALLLPGFLYEIWQCFRNRNYKVLSIILWVVGYILLFAIRLPVVYQHGRYVFPVIVPYLIVGLTGVNAILQQVKSVKSKRLLAVGWLGSILVLSGSFYILGIKTYRADVDVINQLMVQPAKWVSKNIPANQVIAVHDIGAIGYFTQNPLIDLAGLIDPEVVPYMHNETNLFAFMKRAGADYFLGFSDWYATSSTWGNEIKQFVANYQGNQEKVILLRIN